MSTVNFRHLQVKLTKFYQNVDPLNHEAWDKFPAQAAVLITVQIL